MLDCDIKNLPKNPDKNIFEKEIVRFVLNYVNEQGSEG